MTYACATSPFQRRINRRDEGSLKHGALDAKDDTNNGIAAGELSLYSAPSSILSEPRKNRQYKNENATRIGGACRQRHRVSFSNCSFNSAENFQEYANEREEYDSGWEAANLQDNYTKAHSNSNSCLVASSIPESWATNSEASVNNSDISSYYKQIPKSNNKHVNYFNFADHSQINGQFQEKIPAYYNGNHQKHLNRFFSYDSAVITSNTQISDAFSRMEIAAIPADNHSYISTAEVSAISSYVPSNSEVGRFEEKLTPSPKQKTSSCQANRKYRGNTMVPVTPTDLYSDSRGSPGWIVWSQPYSKQEHEMYYQEDQNFMWANKRSPSGRAEFQEADLHKERGARIHPREVGKARSCLELTYQNPQHQSSCFNDQEDACTRQNYEYRNRHYHYEKDEAKSCVEGENLGSKPNIWRYLEGCFKDKDICMNSRAAARMQSRIRNSHKPTCKHSQRKGNLRASQMGEAGSYTVHNGMSNDGSHHSAIQNSGFPSLLQSPAFLADSKGKEFYMENSDYMLQLLHNEWCDAAINGTKDNSATSLQPRWFQAEDNVEPLESSRMHYMHTMQEDKDAKVFGQSESLSYDKQETRGQKLFIYPMSTKPEASSLKGLSSKCLKENPGGGCIGDQLGVSLGTSPSSDLRKMEIEAEKHNRILESSLNDGHNQQQSTNNSNGSSVRHPSWVCWWRKKMQLTRRSSTYSNLSKIEPGLGVVPASSCSEYGNSHKGKMLNPLKRQVFFSQEYVDIYGKAKNGYISAMKKDEQNCLSNEDIDRAAISEELESACKLIYNSSSERNLSEVERATKGRNLEAQAAGSAIVPEGSPSISKSGRNAERNVSTCPDQENYAEKLQEKVAIINGKQHPQGGAKKEHGSALKSTEGTKNSKEAVETTEGNAQVEEISYGIPLATDGDAQYGMELYYDVFHCDRYDMQFQNKFIKLEKKLSAKAHCQFEVWKAEIIEVYELEIYPDAEVDFVGILKALKTMEMSKQRKEFEVRQIDFIYELSVEYHKENAAAGGNKNKAKEAKDVTGTTKEASGKHSQHSQGESNGKGTPIALESTKSNPAESHPVKPKAEMRQKDSISSLPNKQESFDVIVGNEADSKRDSNSADGVGTRPVSPADDKMRNGHASSTLKNRRGDSSSLSVKDPTKELKISDGQPFGACKKLCDGAINCELDDADSPGRVLPANNSESTSAHNEFKEKCKRSSPSSSCQAERPKAVFFEKEKNFQVNPEDRADLGGLRVDEKIKSTKNFKDEAVYIEKGKTWNIEGPVKKSTRLTEEIRKQLHLKEQANEKSLILKRNEKVALKLIELSKCENMKLPYKVRSIASEGCWLMKLTNSMQKVQEAQEEVDNTGKDKLEGDEGGPPATPTALALSRRASTNGNRLKVHEQAFFPIPKYNWTSCGEIINSRSKVIAVAMERIHGRSLTQLLQAPRHLNHTANALLMIEISLSIARAQRIIAETIDNCVINWDTKPGNIMINLAKSEVTSKIHCQRAVIIDLGDSLAGPEFWFPTYRKSDRLPQYIICTKGYCSPECAILVFLSVNSSPSSNFRNAWYGENSSVRALNEALALRLSSRWKSWLKKGFLKRTYTMQDTQKKSASNTSEIPPGGINHSTASNLEKPNSLSKKVSRKNQFTEKNPLVSSELAGQTGKESSNEETCTPTLLQNSNLRSEEESNTKNLGKPCIGDVKNASKPNCTEINKELYQSCAHQNPSQDKASLVASKFAEDSLKDDFFETKLLQTHKEKELLLMDMAALYKSGSQTLQTDGAISGAKSAGGCMEIEEQLKSSDSSKIFHSSQESANAEQLPVVDLNSQFKTMQLQSKSSSPGSVEEKNKTANEVKDFSNHSSGSPQIFETHEVSICPAMQGRPIQEDIRQPGAGSALANENHSKEMGPRGSCLEAVGKFAPPSVQNKSKCASLLPENSHEKLKGEESPLVDFSLHQRGANGESSDKLLGKSQRYQQSAQEDVADDVSGNFSTKMMILKAVDASASPISSMNGTLTEKQNLSAHEGPRVSKPPSINPPVASSSHGSSWCSTHTKLDQKSNRASEDNKPAIQPKNSTSSKEIPPASKKASANNLNESKAGQQVPGGAPAAGQPSNPSKGSWGYWEVKFTSKSAVFSTGIVLAQIFGGLQLLRVVGRDEVRALDALCEWGFVDEKNLYSGHDNLGPSCLLPTEGIFSTEPWRSRVSTLLNGCLAFTPCDR